MNFDVTPQPQHMRLVLEFDMESWRTIKWMAQVGTLKEVLQKILLDRERTFKRIESLDLAKQFEELAPEQQQLIREEMARRRG